MKSVCFTGHRKIKVANELMSRFNETLTYLIENGAINFYADGALG